MSFLASKTLLKLLFHLFSLSLLKTIQCFEQPSQTHSLFAPNSINLTYSHRELKQSAGFEECGEGTPQWHTCVLNQCSLTVNSELFTAVAERNCTFNTGTRLWDCIDISADERSYEAVKFGQCQRTCAKRQVLCRIPPRIQTTNGVHIPTQSCPDGHLPIEYNCNCEILTHAQMISYSQRILGHHGGCRPVCYESDKRLSDCETDRPGHTFPETSGSEDDCDSFVCTFQNCQVNVTATALDIIRNTECTFLQDSRMWSCAGVLEVDEPGYTWVKEGTCMRACDITIALNACLFVPRYGVYPEQWNITASPPEEGEEEEGSRKKTIDRSKRRNRRRRARPSRRKKDQGKIEVRYPPEAAASLPVEDDPQEEGVGKVPKTPDLDDVEASVLVPRNLSVQLTKDDSTDPALLETFSPAETSLPSPSREDRGKVDSSSSEPIAPLVEEDFGDSSSEEEDPRGGKVRQERPPTVAPPFEAVPSVLTIEEPQPSEKLPPVSSSTRLRTTLIELSSDLQQGSGVSEDGEVFLTPWLPCLQICNISTFGANVRERFVTCRSKSTGIALPSSSCLDSNEPTFEECPGTNESTNCQGKYIIKFNSWTSCFQSCNSEQEGNRTRNYECFERLEDESLVSVPKSTCPLPGASSLTLACTPRLCDLVLYRTSEWKDCNCETRTQNRTLTCVKIDTLDTVSVEHCKSRGLIQPRTTRNCVCARRNGPGRFLLQDPDPCERGTGSHCDQPKQINTNNSCSQSVDASCCESGIHDSSFNCCSKGSTLDRNGDCCETAVDVCGQCNGSAVFIDALGKCCENTLDAAGLCCESGNVDECGVCDGFGMSCNFKLVFSTRESPSIACVEDLIFQILPLASDAEDLKIEHAITDESLIVFVPGTVRVTSRGVRLMEELIQDNFHDLSSPHCGDNVLELDTVSRESVQGNDVCEIGETIFIPSSTFTGIFGDNTSWRGAGDCKFVIASCPVSGNESSIGEANASCSNRGICTFAGQAQCYCFTGYQGPSCDVCEPGFFPHNGFCLRSRAESSNFGMTEATEQDRVSVEEDPETGNDERRQDFVVVAAVLISSLLLLILSLFLVVYLTYLSGDRGFLRNDNSSNQGTGIYSRFSPTTPSSSSGLLEGHSISSSTSGVSGGLSFKAEPSSIPPLHRKSPFPFESKHRTNPGTAPSTPSPFMPSSSSNPAQSFPVSAFTNKTMDIRGRMKETRRMPSPDDNQLMTIQERLPVHFETCVHERQTASFGSFDNIELICFTPPAGANPNKMERTRRHSGGVMNAARVLGTRLLGHGSIASLGEYATEDASNEVSVEEAKHLPVSINPENLNTFEFPPPMPTQGVQQEVDQQQEHLTNSGRFLSFLERSTPVRHLSRLLFGSHETSEDSSAFQATATPEHPNPVLTQSDRTDEFQQDENCVVLVPLEDEAPFHQNCSSDSKDQVDF